jgi:hypothetical protein
MKIKCNTKNEFSKILNAETLKEAWDFSRQGTSADRPIVITKETGKSCRKNTDRKGIQSRRN